jgi:hypothetical protein
MPNLEFYAVHTDFHAVHDYVFARSGAVFSKSYSAFDQDLVEFTSVDDVVAELAGRRLERRRPERAPFAPDDRRNVALSNQRHCAHAWAADGHWFQTRNRRLGVISLHLGGVGPRGIVASHSTHKQPDWRQEMGSNLSGAPPGGCMELEGS